MTAAPSPLVGLWTPRRAAAALDEYRHYHRHPELSGREHATAARVEDTLRALGIPVFRCGGTGVVGVLENGPGAVVAFRADTDALPVREETGLPYASTDTATVDGVEVPVMHACGHDAHTAVLLAIATTLAEDRSAWSGTLVLVFQPAEELASGAAAMVADGLWDRAPRPDVVLAQHITAMPAGTLRIGSGNVMNLGDSWRVRIRGRGAHGARPHESIDPVLIAAHTIVRLQSVVSRTVDPAHPVVITVGEVHAGTKENVIPAEATISLNVRTPDDAVRTDVLAAVRRVIEAESAASGAEPPLFEPISSFPRCVNDPAEAARVAGALADVFGADAVATDLRATGSEDVGALADAIGVPLVFWMFGGYRADRAEMPSNHTPGFGPDAPEAIDTGARAGLAALSAYLALPQTPDRPAPTKEDHD